MKKVLILSLLGILFSTISLADDREYWCKMANKVALPVLENLSNGTLKKNMPVETVKGANRSSVSHLEAYGRLLCGIAPWLELGSDSTPEGQMRAKLIGLSLKATRNAVDPTSPDYLNFNTGTQPLVDAAFLAQAFIRSPNVLWGQLDADTKRMVVEAMKSTRRITPYYNNWLLFSATVEAFLLNVGEQCDYMRMDYAIKKHQDWYKGDGAYGDGPDFHWDYYNSFVIQPMYYDVVKVLVKNKREKEATLKTAEARLVRYAEVLERMISPEGTFPPIGRSLAYRTGCMHALSLVSLEQKLPSEILPSQVRAALTAVMKRQLEAKGTFTKDGWFTLGFCGAQPGIAEEYVSTGSVYLSSFIFLPLGLPSSNPFWAEPAAPWTAKKAWSGEDFPIDHALYGM